MMKGPSQGDENLCLSLVRMSFFKTKSLTLTSSTSGGACSGLDLFAGLYIYTAKIVRGILVVTSTLRPLAGASSSSSSTASPDQDSSDDYPEIRISACGDSVGEGRLIFMATPNGDSSYNSSSRYPTIRRPESSDAMME
jgi:hypothetical protein